MSVFRLTILGSSSAIPAHTRFLTAHVLNIDERLFLVDCGEATQMQLRRYKFNLDNLNHIFISHLHGDHYFGLFGLLATFSLMGRKNDLHIYSHRDLQKLIEYQIGYNNEQMTYKIYFHTISTTKSNLIYEDLKVTVHTIPLKHSIDTAGFLFREKPRKLNIKQESIQQYNISIKNINAIKSGADLTLENGDIIPNASLTLPPFKQRSYAFCSDTIYSEKIIPIIKDVDILYHEATYADDREQNAVINFHSTARQAATIAQKAQVKSLIIGHYSTRYKKLDRLLYEAQQVFENTHLAYEGAVFEIPQTRVSI